MTDPLPDDPLLLVDAWIALEDGREQLLNAIDGLDTRLAALPIDQSPGWRIADLLTHVAAWDELVARHLRARAAGARAVTIEAAPEDEWAEWNARQIAAATHATLERRLERLHTARAELEAAAAEIGHALFDEPLGSPWGTRDSARAYLIGQAVHDGTHAAAIALARLAAQ